MNISLTHELEKMISDKVASGRYHSASEVVREALRLLEQQDEVYQARLEQLRKELDIGIEQLDRGERVPFTSATVKRIKSRGRKRLAAQRQVKARA
jgi:antitoxin ParD1/3/4